MASRKNVKKKGDADVSRITAAFSYLLCFVSAVIVLLLRYDDEHAKFHSLQSILFWALWIVGGFAVAAVAGVLLLVPFIGWIFGVIVVVAFYAAFLVSWIYLMYKALKGEKYEYPLIGKYAARW
ncbi:MAG: DUF4870 domain-containing protein [Candidatus Micrarchaeia archaeon]|jgi:uncharacterized membrane protein